MVGLTDYAAEATLAWLVGKTAMPTLPTVYVGLFTVVGLDDGTGFTEVSGGGYARVATTGSSWNAPSGSAPSMVDNASTLTFAEATANWGSVIGFGLFDAATSGNLLAWDYIGAYDWAPATVSLASPGVLTSPAHGYSDGDYVVFTTEFGGTAPTFSQSNLSGTLVVANAATDSFTVTNAGTAVNTSAAGEGMVRKIIAQSIPSGVQASFAAGALSLKGA